MLNHLRLEARGGLFLAAALAVAFLFISIPFAQAATTWNVSTDSTGACTSEDPNCATIQAAIDNASIGDIIEIAPGTYLEQIVITKSIKLNGTSGSATTIVQAPGSMLDPFGYGANIVTVKGPSVDAEITGLTITGPGPSNCGSIRAGIFVADTANANIHDNVISELRDEPIGGCQNGQGIFVGRAFLGTTGTAAIVNNVITGYQKGGIVVDNTGSSATITGNTVTGKGPVSYIAQNGIQVSRGAIATISGNIVSGNDYTPTDDISTGILLFKAGDATVVGQNTVSGNEVGIWTSSQASVGNINLSGFSGNGRNAVADYDGGFPGDSLNEYTAWTVPDLSSTKFVVSGTVDDQGGDIANINGSLRVLGWDSFASIQTAIDAAGVGDTINVAAGTYSESPTINKALTLSGSAGATINGLITIGYDNVTVSGLTLTNPGGNYAVSASGVNNLAISNNAITNVGTNSVTGNIHSIIYMDGASDSSGVSITNNAFSHIGNTSGGSTSGVGILDSTGTANISGVVISGNTISNITASGAKGAYGIIINHARYNVPANMGSTTAPQVTNNTISNLSGGWATGIGLEGNTPNAVVTGNSVSGFTSSISQARTAVMFEDNPSSATVTLRNNIFNTQTLDWGVMSKIPSVTIDASQNYWATSTPASATVATAGGSASVTFSPWYINPGRTVLNTAVSDSTVTATSGTLDFAETDDGAVELPEGVSTLAMGNDSVLDFSANANTKTGTDIIVAGATTSLSTFSVEGGTADLTAAQTVGGQSVTVEQAVTLSSGTSSPIVITNAAVPNASVSIPDATTILAPSGWDGTIQPPKSGSSAGTAPSGFSVGGTVIEVGSPTAVLLFNKAVTIVLSGVTGAVGYKPAGVDTSWVQITSTCGGTYESPASPVFPGECAISNGTDTKIVTFHFTTFGSLVVPAPAPSTGGGGGGGGGGIVGANFGVVERLGAQVATAATAQTPAPAQGQVLGATTYNFAAALAIGSTGDEVTELQKRLSAEGVYSGPVTGYFGSLTSQAVKLFQAKYGISQVGVVGPQTRSKLNATSAAAVPGCEGGNKFNTETGKPCVSATAASSGQAFGAAVSAFARSLAQGSRGDDVTALQNRLTAERVYKGPVTGYFGPLTAQAVKEFQAKYGIEAVGVVGPKTMAELNKAQ